MKNSSPLNFFFNQHILKRESVGRNDNKLKVCENSSLVLLCQWTIVLKLPYRRQRSLFRSITTNLISDKTQLFPTATATFYLCLIGHSITFHVLPLRPRLISLVLTDWTYVPQFYSRYTVFVGFFFKSRQHKCVLWTWAQHINWLDYNHNNCTGNWPHVLYCNHNYGICLMTHF